MKPVSEIKKFTNWKRQWSNPEKIGFLDYISMEIHPENLLIMAHLLYPEFIEHEGSVFFAENFNEEGYLEWKKQLFDDPQAIERLINHVHVYDIFDSEDVEEPVYEEIGKLLQKSWSIHLKNSFPDKNIVVELHNNEEDYGPTIVAYQQK